MSIIFSQRKFHLCSKPQQAVVEIKKAWDFNYIRI